jgi:hypothetical protein
MSRSGFLARGSTARQTIQRMELTAHLVRTPRHDGTGAGYASPQAG